MPKGFERPEELRWVGEPIHLGKHFEEFQEIIPKEYKVKANCGSQCIDKKVMASVMGVSLSDAEMYELSRYCKDEQLDVDGEPPKYLVAPSSKKLGYNERYKIPSAGECDLSTLRELRERENDKVFLKYSSSAFIFNQAQKGEKRKTLIPMKDIVIFVKVYDPYHCTESHLCKPGSFKEEFAVIGSQTLDALQDRISCPNDLARVENSEHPDQKIGKTAKEVFKSGFFFINNTFYNDFRHEGSVDYSRVIREWAERKGYGALPDSLMSQVRFEELTVRFGYPYVYLHQGNCEHLIVFSDARFLHESDSLSLKSYPMLVAVGTFKKQLCSLCNMFVARWVTMENERVLNDPMYFCSQCFKSYNYKDGKKIGKFKAYELT